MKGTRGPKTALVTGALLLALGLPGCVFPLPDVVEPASSSDTGSDGVHNDAGLASPDTGHGDTADAGNASDSGNADVGGAEADAGAPDAGAPDTGASDTGTPDTGTPDAGDGADGGGSVDSGLTVGSVPVGSGYITGIVLHPTQRDLAYIRSDIGGAYRWDPAAARWISMTETVDMDAQYTWSGVRSIAVARDNPFIVRLLVGRELGVNGLLLNSSDQGVSFGNLALAVPVDGNLPRRWIGESAVIDPSNVAMMLVGTQTSGLWRTTNSGASFNRIGTLTGSSPQGISTVVKDFNSGLAYLAVWGDGIHRSSDHGLTWERLTGSPPTVVRMEVASDGVLYATTEDAGVNGVVWYDGTFHGIAPASSATGYAALAVNPRDPAELLVMAADNPAPMLYRSTNRGTTWQAKSARLTGAPPWFPSDAFTHRAASLAFDPQVPGRVWETDWYGVWRTDDIEAEPADWTSLAAGHEGATIATLCAPPGGELFSGVWEFEGFRHQDWRSYPSQRLSGRWEDTYEITFCESTPAHMVRTVGNHRAAQEGGVEVSNDGGASWQTLSAWARTDKPRKVAVSASNPNVFVVTRAGAKPLRTTDGGATFTPVASLPNGPLSPYNVSDNLLADPYDGTVFYSVDTVTGAFYRSNDSGSTFSQRSTLLANEWKTVLERGSSAGVIYAALDKRGLWRSTNFGDTFTQVASVTRAALFATGKPSVSGQSRPLYLFGTPVGSASGLYRSLDSATTWTRIEVPGSRVNLSPVSLEASEATYGLVFVGTSGRGIFYRTE